MFNSRAKHGLALLFNIRPIKSSEDVRSAIRKLVSRQKKGSIDDLTPFAEEIERLLSLLDFKPQWTTLPMVSRAARIKGAQAKNSEVLTYSDDIVLPNTKHDLDLVIKMLNHLREQKQLRPIKMPIFVQPDELLLARKEGKITFDDDRILSQISLILQKGAIMYVGFVFGRNYVLLVP